LMSTTAAHAERVRAVAAAKQQGGGGKDSGSRESGGGTWQAPPEFVSPLSSSKDRAAAKERLARRMAYPAPGHKPVKGKTGGSKEEALAGVAQDSGARQEAATGATGTTTSPPPSAQTPGSAAKTPASAVRPVTEGTPRLQHRYASVESKGMNMSLTSAAKLTGSVANRTPGSATRTGPSVRGTPARIATATAATGSHPTITQAAPKQLKEVSRVM
jgi:hypothetical protein